MICDLVDLFGDDFRLAALVRDVQQLGALTPVELEQVAYFERRPAAQAMIEAERARRHRLEVE